MLDPVKNFGIVTVSSGYNSSDTSIVLSGGNGAILPDPSTDGAFNLVWYNASDYFNPTDDPNKEIVRVTARSTDTLTVVRAQEGTSASTKNTAGKTYKMILAFTKKMRDDIDRILAGLPEGTMWNGKIVPSVSSGNLTLSLKTLAGNDPSSSDPVYSRIGDSVREIKAALSVSVSSGTNTMNLGSAELATKEVDLFATLGYNATDGVVLGFSRYPGGRQYSDFSTTATNEKYMAVSNRTNAAATDYYEVIGRFAATLSGGAGYTWSVPTYTPNNLIQEKITRTRNDLLFDSYVYGNSGSAGAFSKSSSIQAYSFNGDMMKVLVRFNIANKGSWSGGFFMTLPFSPKSTLHTGEVLVGFATVVANGANPATSGKGIGKVSSSNSIYFLSSVDTGNLIWSSIAVNDVVYISAVFEI